MPAGSSGSSPRPPAEAAPGDCPSARPVPAAAPAFPHGLPSPFFLAPVAGYSDAAFRSVCSELGAGLCYTEMVSSEGLTRSHPKTRLLLARSESEPYYAIQLFGSKPEVLARAAEAAAAYEPVCIDLNCGCPVPKIIKSGAGSALLKEPVRLAAIVRAMVAASGLPITVKIRTGWDETSINYLDIAAAAVEAGASAVTLHGRTKAQGYAGKADWEAIRTLVYFLRPRGIPVFGSGDASDAKKAICMLRETECAGVMIARGAMGNPFVFAESAALLRGLPWEPPGNAEIAAVAQRHLERSLVFLGEKTACAEFRKQLCAYTKGRPGGAALRERAVRCSSPREFMEVLEDFTCAAPDSCRDKR